MYWSQKELKQLEIQAAENNMTVEEFIADFEERWEAIGRDTRTQEEKDAIKQKEEERTKRYERFQHLKEIRDAWFNLDVETINTLLIKYKDTKDSSYFEQAWKGGLATRYSSYVKKHLVRGLPNNIKQFFLNGFDFANLEDELYEVLLYAFDKWNPKSTEHYIRSFPKFFEKAVENYTGGLKTKLKQPKYKDTSIKHVDFNNESELNLLISSEPNIQKFVVDDHSEDVLNELYINQFAIEKLSEKQKKIIKLIINGFNQTQIAKELKQNKMWISREIKKIKDLWLQYEKIA